MVFNVCYTVFSVCYMVFLFILPLLVLAGLNVRLIREVKALGRRRLEMRRANVTSALQ